MINNIGNWILCIAILKLEVIQQRESTTLLLKYTENGIVKYIAELISTYMYDVSSINYEYRCSYTYVIIP